MSFNRILPNPVWLPAVMQRTTPEELEALRSHPRLQSSLAEFAGVEEVLALLPRFQAAAAAAKAAPVAELISGGELTYHPTEWVWPGRIARGKLTLIGGAPGSGKTTLAMELISCVTTGTDWPCGEGVAPKGSVLLIAPQSDPDTFVPRLKAAGTDLARLHTIRTVKDGTRSRRFNLDKDIAALDPLITGIKDLRMIVIDAVHVQSSRGRAAAREAGALFDTLAELAQRHNVAVLAIAHPVGADYLSRKPISFGALPLTAVCAAFLVEADPADANRRLLLQVKNDLTYDPGTLSFCITERSNTERPSESAAGVKFAPHKLAVDRTRIHGTAGAQLQLREGGGDRISARPVRRHDAPQSPRDRAGGARARVARREPAAQSMPGPARRPHGLGIDCDARGIRQGRRLDVGVA